MTATGASGASGATRGGPRSIDVGRSLRSFTGRGYDKGRPVAVQAAWFAVQNLVFAKWWFPARWRPVVLRAFGATIGERVFVRHRVRVLWPWKLTIGDDSWIGEDAWLLDLEPITIGADVCVSQGAFLCTGSHDAGDAAFEYGNAPITVGAWWPPAPSSWAVPGSLPARWSPRGPCAAPAPNPGPDDAPRL